MILVDIYIAKKDEHEIEVLIVKKKNLFNFNSYTFIDVGS